MRLVNLQAPIAHSFYRGVARYLTARLPFEVHFDEGAAWQLQAAALLRGEVELGVICGLPYVRHAERLVPLAAPVMAAERYQDQAVYFSDVVVAADAPFRAFSDLKGVRWCYNEPGSHSGVELVRYEWARRELPADFFREVTASGAHQTSLEWIRQGRAEVSAIDSTVLEMVLRANPKLAKAFRVIDTWGPSPMPPIVASRRVDQAIRAAIQAALVGMHEESDGRAVLALGMASRFAAVSDGDYDPLRRMNEAAKQCTWVPEGALW